MDTLSFIAALVDAVAWPAAILGAIALLRSPLIALLPQLTEFKYKDVSLVFRKGVEEAKEMLPPLEPARPAPELSFESERARLEKLAETSPQAAVIQSWALLESASLARLQEQGVIAEIGPFLGHGRTGIALETSGLLSGVEAKVFQKLRKLRNQAAHSSQYSLSVADAAEYVMLALRLTEKISPGV
jgi:hypothetical protein